jgi:signal transduction histidine kinase
LPIAKWIVDTHGGRVAVASSCGETVVSINLPLRA